MSLSLAVVLIALPALGFILLPFWRRPRMGESEPGLQQAAQELLETKRALYRGMKELEFDHQAGHLSDEDYEKLRSSYEARAAEALKGLDELGIKSDVQERRARERDRATHRAREPVGRSWSRRPAVLVLGAAILVGFGLALGMLLTKFTTPESPAMGTAVPAPPQPMPGGAGQEGSPRSIPPEMVRGMLDAAHQSLDAGRFQEAIAAYRAVLARYPQNVEAITHLGIILGMADHVDAAIEAFDKALAIDPVYPHALWDKGRLLSEAKQDFPGAIRAWERFVAVAPAGADRDRAQELIREAKGKLAGKK